MIQRRGGNRNSPRAVRTDISRSGAANAGQSCRVRRAVHFNSMIMQRSIASVLSLTTCLLLAFAATVQADDKKPNPAGTWKWSFTGQNGQTRETTLKLKLEGEKLTGSMSGRNGDTAIDDAKIKGDEISFAVTREFNGNKMTSKYNGKLSGDTIKGKVETERDGEKRSRDWEAKREK